MDDLKKRLHCYFYCDDLPKVVPLNGFHFFFLMTLMGDGTPTYSVRFVLLIGGYYIIDPEIRPPISFSN